MELTTFTRVAEGSPSEMFVVYKLGKERAIVATGMGTRGAGTKTQKSLVNVTVGNHGSSTSAVKNSLEYSSSLWQVTCLSPVPILALSNSVETHSVTLLTIQQRSGWLPDISYEIPPSY